jgi:hypothetical protein
LCSVHAVTKSHPCKINKKIASLLGLLTEWIRNYNLIRLELQAMVIAGEGSEFAGEATMTHGTN